LNTGSKKYSDNNWMKVDNAHDRYFNAAMRHFDCLERRREDLMAIVKLPTLAHCMCCILFLMWFDNNKVLTNDLTYIVINRG